MLRKYSKIRNSRLWRAQVCAVSVLFFQSSDPVAGVEGTLTADRDNSLYEHPDGAQSNGSGRHLFVGRNNGLSQRALVFFDVAASIPDGSMIERVSLTMSVSNRESGSDDVFLHRVLADWGEGDSVADEEGRGAVAMSGDATWIHSFSGDTMWESAGGDFSSISSAEARIGGVGSYTWESTSNMITDVQGWLDDPSTNFGWILVGNETAHGNAKRFDSREHENEENRPVLTVVFDLTAVDDISWGMVKLEAR